MPTYGRLGEPQLDPYNSFRKQQAQEEADYNAAMAQQYALERQQQDRINDWMYGGYGSNDARGSNSAGGYGGYGKYGNDVAGAPEPFIPATEPINPIAAPKPSGRYGMYLDPGDPSEMAPPVAGEQQRRRLFNEVPVGNIFTKFEMEEPGWVKTPTDYVYGTRMVDQIPKLPPTIQTTPWVKNPKYAEWQDTQAQNDPSLRRMLQGQKNDEARQKHYDDRAEAKNSLSLKKAEDSSEEAIWKQAYDIAKDGEGTPGFDIHKAAAAAYEGIKKNRRGAQSAISAPSGGVGGGTSKPSPGVNVDVAPASSIHQFMDNGDGTVTVTKGRMTARISREEAIKRGWKG